LPPTSSTHETLNIAFACYRIIAPVPIDVTASDDIGANKSPSKTLSVFQRGEEEQDDDFDDEEDENWGEE
jgi:hypothetical protein